MEALSAGGMDGSQRQTARRHRVSGQCLKQEGVSGEIPMKKQTKRTVPRFAGEAEEAAWWYKNRKIHDKELLAALRSGEAQILTKEKLLARIAAPKKTPAPVVALRIPEADLALARKQAEEKGLPYQTYIKSLLHETLVKRERRRHW
jgi:predicted DNA binding CopG/RHH family protein